MPCPSKSKPAPAPIGLRPINPYHHLRITQVPGTDLIKIRARHPNREDARDIAASIPHAADFIRQELHAAESRKQRAALQAALAEQE